MILTSVVSFSHNFELPLLILSLSIAIIILTKTPLRSWMKIITLTLAWATLVSIPLPFITPGKSVMSFTFNSMFLNITEEGIHIMIIFILRIVSASSIFTAFVLVIGWRGIIKGLEFFRIPRELTLLLKLSVIHIPLTIREAAKMISARDARIMKDIGVKELWKTLASVVGELFLRCYERAWRVDKAIKARSFESSGNFTRF
ncbi:energy-coupling factor transporter transmembrane component T family protein [[Eubacterium] cellulosolvens]